MVVDDKQTKDPTLRGLFYLTKQKINDILISCSSTEGVFMKVLVTLLRTLGELAEKKLFPPPHAPKNAREQQEEVDAFVEHQGYIGSIPHHVE